MCLRPQHRVVHAVVVEDAGAAGGNLAARTEKKNRTTFPTNPYFLKEKLRTVDVRGSDQAEVEPPLPVAVLVRANFGCI